MTSQHLSTAVVTARPTSPSLTLFAYQNDHEIKTWRSFSLSHTHLRLATAGAVLIGVETGRSCGLTHTHTHTCIAAECCADGALTSHRMYACLSTALISVCCTATAAQRPQCGCDTWQGERGGGGRRRGNRRVDTTNWEMKRVR